MKKLLAVGIALCGIATINNTLASQGSEQDLLEIFDGVCVQAKGDFQYFQTVVEAFNAEDVSDKLKDPNMEMNGGGKSYLLPYHGRKFVTGFIKNGGCSVAAQTGIDAPALIKLITENFDVDRSSKIDDTATQTTMVFVLGENSGLSRGGLVFVTYSKPSTGWEMASLSFIDSELARQLNI